MKQTQASREVKNKKGNKVNNNKHDIKISNKSVTKVIHELREYNEEPQTNVLTAQLELQIWVVMDYLKTPDAKQTYSLRLTKNFKLLDLNSHILDTGEAIFRIMQHDTDLQKLQDLTMLNEEKAIKLLKTTAKREIKNELTKDVKSFVAPDFNVEPIRDVYERMEIEAN